VPHTRVRSGHGGIGGAPRRVCGTLAGGCAPVLSRLVSPEAGRRAHGFRGLGQPCRTPLVRAQSCLSAGIDPRLAGGPQTHHDARGGATGRTAGRARGWGRARGRPALAGLSLPDQQADGRERDSTARMEKAEVADFLKALGQDVLEEPAEKLHDVEVGGAGAGTAHLPIGERDHAVLQADETVVGDGDLEDIRGEVDEGGVAVVVRLTVDIPGDGPDLRIDLLQQTGVAHLVVEERTVDGRERFDRDNKVGAGGQPR
jgi:hypothetical protein